MKYFTPELWADINSEDILIKNAANERLDKNIMLYNEYFSSIKHLLTKSFLTTYDKCHSFHDMFFKQISIIEERQWKTKIVMQLTDELDIYQLEFINVTSYNFDFKGHDNCIMWRPSWGYCEFESIDSERMKISILCDIKNQLEIVFKKIIAKKIK